jgi:sugar/nucleoside kinase (ribokinase family)
MGLTVGLVTSYHPTIPIEELNGIQIVNHRAESTTTFENTYTPSGRRQSLLSRANPLGMEQIPTAWRTAAIVHLGPVAQEISPEIGQHFPDAAVVGYSLQGWLRRWDQEGRISPSPFPQADLQVSAASAAFLSLEDLGDDRSPLESLRNLFPLLILTKGYAGAEIFTQDEILSIPAESVQELDPTGAGDIFATGFMIFNQIHGKSIPEAARLASRLAAISVTRSGLKGIPGPEEIESLPKVH